MGRGVDGDLTGAASCWGKGVIGGGVGAVSVLGEHADRRPTPTTGMMAMKWRRVNEFLFELGILTSRGLT
jgi:hypothetical protein